MPLSIRFDDDEEQEAILGQLLGMPEDNLIPSQLFKEEVTDLVRHCDDVVRGLAIDLIVKWASYGLLPELCDNIIFLLNSQYGPYWSDGLDLLFRLGSEIRTAFITSKQVATLGSVLDQLLTHEDKYARWIGASSAACLGSTLLTDVTKAHLKRLSSLGDDVAKVCAVALDALDKDKHALSEWSASQTQLTAPDRVVLLNAFRRHRAYSERDSGASNGGSDLLKAAIASRNPRSGASPAAYETLPSDLVWSLHEGEGLRVLPYVWHGEGAYQFGCCVMDKVGVPITRGLVVLRHGSHTFDRDLQDGNIGVMTLSGGGQVAIKVQLHDRHVFEITINLDRLD